MRAASRANPISSAVLVRAASKMSLSAASALGSAALIGRAIPEGKNGSPAMPT